jgi:hypothetical protein
LLTAVADLRRRVDAATARRFAELSEEELRAAAALAVEFLDAAVDGHVDWPHEDVLESVPVDEWLMNLPGLLVHAGLLAEARVVAERAVEADPESDVMYLGDLAQSLAADWQELVSRVCQRHQRCRRFNASSASRSRTSPGW